MKKPFYKKWWFWVIVVVIVVAATGGSGDTNEKSDTTFNEPKQETKKDNNKNEQPKGISKEGTSSDVKVSVGSVESADSVGGEYSKETAQGIFKIVEVTLENNQKDAITIDANNFKLVDNKGREFSYSTNGQTALGIENGGNLDFFLKSLNPGLSQTGKIVFDVPKDAVGFILKARGGMTGKEIKLKVD